MKQFLLAITLLFAGQSNASECNVGETIVASCDLPGKVKSTATLCSNGKSGDLYYVFKSNGIIQLKVDFSTGRKIKRWVDKWTYTTYFGFSQGRYDYILIVPEEKPNAVAFLNVKKDGIYVSMKKCSSNSFGEKDIQSDKVEDFLDSSVRDNGFKFP